MWVVFTAHRVRGSTQNNEASPEAVSKAEANQTNLFSPASESQILTYATCTCPFCSANFLGRTNAQNRGDVFFGQPSFPQTAVFLVGVAGSVVVVCLFVCFTRVTDLVCKGNCSQHLGNGWVKEPLLVCVFTTQHKHKHKIT